METMNVHVFKLIMRKPGTHAHIWSPTKIKCLINDWVIYYMGKIKDFVSTFKIMLSSAYLTTFLC